MPEPAPPPTIDRFRLLGLDVTLEVDPPELLGPLQHIVTRARDQGRVARSVNVRLSSGDRGLEVHLDGQSPRQLCCTDVALAHIHMQLTRQARELYPEHTTLHCGAATIDGQLVLMTGDRGAGKTTLLARLLLDGQAFHCDEFVLTQSGMAMSFPRPLHVKPGTLECLPEMARACSHKPLLQHWNGVKYFPVDPEELGVSWSSVCARPAAILHLEPDFDRPPAITPIPRIEMVKRLMCQTLDRDPDISRQARDICALVRGTPCFALRAGPLDDTLALIRRTVAGHNPT